MLLLILVYPLLVHWAATKGTGLAVWAALMGPIVALLLLSPRWRGPWAWAVAGVIGIAALCLIRMHAAAYLPFLPSVLIPLVFLVIFSRGLAGPGPSLVTRIATAIDGELPPEVIDYTRRVNYLWSGFFVLMTLANLLIALLAARERWALFIDCINYAAVGLVFVGEYMFRRVRFPRREHRAFPDYIRRVARIDYRRLVE